MDNTYIITPDGELYHWGIKGMKWGVRRYQNKDGSLTPAGRKRLTTSNKVAKPKKSAAQLRKEIAELKPAVIEGGKSSALGALGGIGLIGLNVFSAATAGIIMPSAIVMGAVTTGMGAAGLAVSAIGGVKVASLEAQLRRAERTERNN